MKQFQALANETNSFEAERENMERSIRSQQQEVTTLQAELLTVRRRLGELEQLYAQQKTAGVQSEMQADDLLRRLGILERDLRDERGDKVFQSRYRLDKMTNCTVMMSDTTGTAACCCTRPPEPTGKATRKTPNGSCASRFNHPSGKIGMKCRNHLLLLTLLYLLPLDGN